MNYKIKNTCLFCIFFVGCFGFTFSQEFIVIAHKDIGLESISSKELKYVFLGKLIKVKGQKTIPVTLKNGAIHDKFLEKHIKKNSRQFSKYWKKILFTGKGKPPKSFKTAKELIKYVASTPGAIAYVSAKTKLEGVVRLKIE